MSNNGSPTFVAVFADGNTTRMTTHCSRKKLDPARGVRLARIAYESRMKRSPPAIERAHFERVGVTLQQYAREDLS
jgi:hypothetical protein